MQSGGMHGIQRHGCGDGGVSARHCASLSAPARAAPGSIGIGWNGVAGATRYTLQESSNGGGWVTLFDGNAGSYATAARGVGSYGYRVAACNGAGCGPWSATATVAVIGPPTIEPVINAPGR